MPQWHSRIHTHIYYIYIYLSIYKRKKKKKNEACWDQVNNHMSCWIKLSIDMDAFECRNIKIETLDSIAISFPPFIITITSFIDEYLKFQMCNSKWLNGSIWIYRWISNDHHHVAIDNNRKFFVKSKNWTMWWMRQKRLPSTKTKHDIFGGRKKKINFNKCKAVKVILKFR